MSGNAGAGQEVGLDLAVLFGQVLFELIGWPIGVCELSWLLLDARRNVADVIALVLFLTIRQTLANMIAEISLLLRFVCQTELAGRCLLLVAGTFLPDALRLLLGV